MKEILIEWAAQFPRELAVIILSALPITELRLALPLAMHRWLFTPFEALGLSVFGNVLPLVPLYFGLNWLRSLAERFMPWLTKWIDKIVDRAHNRVKEKYERHGALALFLFTALPLPLTGLYTATLAAVALKVPFKYAAPAIITGVFTAGIIVTILSYSAELYF